jgi:hypothetical protein
VINEGLSEIIGPFPVPSPRDKRERNDDPGQKKKRPPVLSTSIQSRDLHRSIVIGGQSIILTTLRLNRSNWVETVRGFGRLFKHAAGRSSSLVDAATRRSRRWFQGKAAARTAFVQATGSTPSPKQTFP